MAHGGALDLVGTGEIAEMFGVSLVAVRKWRARDSFPEPVAVIGKAEVWMADDIREWAEEHRRPPGRPRA